MKSEKFSVTGMTCAACQANITRNVQKLDGVDEVNVNLLSNQMSVSYDEAKISSADIINAVVSIGYGAESMEAAAASGGRSDDFRSEWQTRQKNAEDAQKAMQRRLIWSIILLVPLMYIAMGHMLHIPVPHIFMGTENAVISAFTQFLITVPILIINRKFFTSGYKALIKRAPNMDSLVAIGSSAALIYGIFAIYRMAYGLGHGDLELVSHYSHELYFESSAMILTLVTVGKYLESRSKSKTSDALGKLIDLAPKTAVVIRNGAEKTIPAEQVTAGDIVVIKPGESIPVDGVITEGGGYVDQSAITGESIPVEKNVGDNVISATINKNGSFKFKASKVGNDTTLAHIIRLVDEAGNSKAPIARLADKVSGVFVPTVIAIAILTAIVWIIAGQTFEFALSSAITVLVISCPCALGLATPVAIMAGTGKAAEYGILIKSAESLENLHSIDTIVLDKTGTITSGHPSVTDIVAFDKAIDERTFLAEAAAVESGSEHPLAEAVVERARDMGLGIPAADGFEAVSGRGVKATIGDSEYIAGNVNFMQENNVSNIKTVESEAGRLAKEGKTPLVFARNGKPVGIIAVADTVRESSVDAINRFNKMGLDVVMLTGDNKLTAEAIRKKLGIKTAISDVMPAQKEACIRELQAKGRKVAMVGDGINDAPALTRADIGIAIGAGTDIAIDSADVVLMKDSLGDVVTAIELSKSVIRNIHMNLFWAFFYNILGIPVAAGVLYPAFGLRLSPMIGSAAMSLSSVCVVTNALRLRFFKSKISAGSGEERYDDGADAAKAAEENNSVKRIEGKAEAGEKTSGAESDMRNARENVTLKNNKTNNSINNEKGWIIMKKAVTVEGMSCAHCQAHVKKALEEIEGVELADVNLETKIATVALSKDVADDVLKDAVDKAGYSATNVETL